MEDSIITLTTDFGTASPFVAAMKGVILGINPSARLVDLSHDIPPFSIRHAAFFLANSIPYFPPHTLHVVVVDPGVGSDRAVLYVEVGGQYLLVPDNGCWTRLAQGQPRPPRAARVTQERFWRPHVSTTFHGRDIFAPVAAHLSLGVDPEELGPIVTEWKMLDWPAPVRSAESITGEVVFVDHFGNLITNIPGDLLPGAERSTRITLSGGVEARRVRAYSDSSAGSLVALVSSNGSLEIAEVQGNASRRLSAGVGASVRVEWSS